MGGMLAMRLTALTSSCDLPERESTGSATEEDARLRKRVDESPQILEIMIDSMLTKNTYERNGMGEPVRSAERIT